MNEKIGYFNFDQLFQVFLIGLNAKKFIVEIVLEKELLGDCDKKPFEI